MTEQLQRHVCYHYNGFDEVCRKVLDVCDYEVGIHNNNDFTITTDTDIFLKVVVTFHTKTSL